MTDEEQGFCRLDMTTPNVARIWDYQLGGKDNYAADRAAAEKLNEACEAVGAPTGRAVARENRAFIGRVVSWLARAGIDQFLDIGAGLPTAGNVHEIAQAVNPDARTVYVDYDVLVASHGRALLADHDQTVMVQADVRDPDSILGSPSLRDHLDLSRPVAVLFVAVLHLLTDEENPAGIVAQFRDALAPGSYLALTHVTRDKHLQAAADVAELFARMGVTTPLVPRSKAEIRSFFDGFSVIKPGLVSPARWRPAPEDSDSESDTEWMYAGVGKLRSRAPRTS